MITLNARQVGKALGAVAIPNGWLAKCPAHDDTKPSLTISDGRNGLLLHCWAGCEFSAIASAVEAIVGGEAPEKVEHSHRCVNGNLDRVKAAIKMWECASALCAVSKRYLQRRGILGAKGASALRSAVLRHPETGEMAPAILAPRMDAPGRVVGIQRTFLDEVDCTKYRDGQAKFSLGDGMFSMLGHGPHILLSEGLENALSAELLARIPGSVGWACLKGFPNKRLNLPGVASVRLIVDHDKSGTSQKKAAEFAKANLNNTFTVHQWLPPKLGSDANDFLMENMV